MPWLDFPPGAFAILLLVLAALLALGQASVGLYCAWAFLGSPFRRRAAAPEGPPGTRFLVLLPARDEERVIRRAVDSVLALDYPAELLDAVVIADNCTDATASIAASCGVRVLERTDPLGRTKAKAIGWALYDRGLLDAGYDAVCLLDADNVVSPAFLRHVDRRIREGHAVVQGRCESANPFASFASSFSSILFTLGNRFWHLPLANRGLSIVNYGTGVAIRTDHLRRIGWDTKTLVEDTEFGVQTILAGEAAFYCDEAEYRVEHPTRLSTYWRQQRRWQSGMVDCARLHLVEAVRRWARTRDRNALTAAVKLSMPYFCVLGLLQLLLAPALSVALLGAQAFSPAAFLMGLAYSLVSGFASAFLILAIDGSFSPRMWRGILLFPAYPLFLGLVATASVLRPKRTWETIEHGQAEKEAPPQASPSLGG